MPALVSMMCWLHFTSSFSLPFIRMRTVLIVSFLFFAYSAQTYTALEQLTKSEHYVNQTTVNATSAVSGNGATSAGPYQTYTNKAATNVYQPSSVTPQVYNNQNYANAQPSNNSSSYSSSANTYSSYNQGAVNSYQAQQSNLTNSVNNSSSVTNVSNSGTTSVGSTSSVNNTR